MWRRPVLVIRPALRELADLHDNLIRSYAWDIDPHVAVIGVRASPERWACWLENLQATYVIMHKELHTDFTTIRIRRRKESDHWYRRHRCQISFSCRAMPRQKETHTHTHTHKYNTHKDLERCVNIP